MSKIGIVARRGSTGGDFARDCYLGVGGEYIEYLNQFLLPEDDLVFVIPGQKFDPTIDLLILPGGEDVIPQTDGRYSPMIGNHNSGFEHFLRHDLAQYINARTPIFGICAGFQALGTYYNHMLASDIRNHQSTGHSVLVADEAIYGEPRLNYVTSRHHQGFNTWNWKQGPLIPTAFSLANYSPEGLKTLEKGGPKKMIEEISSQEWAIGNRVVEAFRHPELPIWGVQWHPESIYDEGARFYPRGDFYSNAIIRHLLKTKRNDNS